MTPTKLTIKHVCGHETVHLLTGSGAEKHQREAWLQNLPCRECWQQARSDHARTINTDAGLPPLSGSPDEVAMAEVIRARALEHSRDFLQRVAGPQNNDDNDEIRHTAASAAEQALQELEAHTTAAWWLENRFDAASYVRRAATDAIAPLLEARNGQG